MYICIYRYIFAQGSNTFETLRCLHDNMLFVFVFLEFIFCMICRSLHLKVTTNPKTTFSLEATWSVMRSSRVIHSSCPTMAPLDVTFQEVLPNCSTNPSRGLCFSGWILSITGDGDMGDPSKHITSFGGEFWDNCCKTSTKNNNILRRGWGGWG